MRPEKRYLLKLIFGIAVAFVAMFFIDKWFYANHRVRCSDFSRQSDAQKALIGDGQTQLDHNKDGIACNDLAK